MDKFTGEKKSFPFVIWCLIVILLLLVSEAVSLCNSCDYLFFNLFQQNIENCMKNKHFVSKEQKRFEIINLVPIHL